MRYVLGAVLIVALILLAAWWGFGRLKAGPPEAVVTEFLRAVTREDWGTAQAYMTRHIRGRLGQEGIGATERFVQARLEPFRSFEIARVSPRGDETDVVARLLLPVPEGAAPQATPAVGAHTSPGRLEGSRFVHAHRFVLQQEGRAWRIYQFEEVDDRS